MLKYLTLQNFENSFLELIDLIKYIVEIIHYSSKYFCISYKISLIEFFNRFSSYSSSFLDSGSKISQQLNTFPIKLENSSDIVSGLKLILLPSRSRSFFHRSKNSSIKFSAVVIPFRNSLITETYFYLFYRYFWFYSRTL